MYHAMLRMTALVISTIVLFLIFPDRAVATIIVAATLTADGLPDSETLHPILGAVTVSVVAYLYAALAYYLRQIASPYQIPQYRKILAALYMFLLFAAMFLPVIVLRRFSALDSGH